MAASAKIVSEIAAALPAPEPAATSEQVTQRREGDTLEARSTSRRIKTVEDLLAHIEADMTRFEVAASEATKWEVGTSDGDGGTTVTELHRVFVRLRPKAGPSVAEAVAAMIDAAKGEIRRPKTKGHAKAKPGLWQVLVVSDTHFGNYSWHQTTGSDWDLDIASRVVGDTAAELLMVGNAHKPTRRTVAFLGDLFHYDTPAGTTTSGTPLERDGRLQKMLAGRHRDAARHRGAISRDGADRCRARAWQPRRDALVGVPSAPARAVPQRQAGDNRRAIHRAEVPEPRSQLAWLCSRAQGEEKTAATDGD
jgi:hypothetical protein